MSNCACPTRECGVFHTKGQGSWHVCEMNFLVSSIIVRYNMWCLLCHINYISSDLLCEKNHRCNIHVGLHPGELTFWNLLAITWLQEMRILTGDSTLFPRGLLHFEINLGRENATYISALNSQNPGTLVHNYPALHSHDQLVYCKLRVEIWRLD